MSLATNFKTIFSIKNEGLVRITMLFLLSILFYRYLSNNLPYQMYGPPLKIEGINITQILFSLSGLGALISNNEMVRIIFSVLLFILPILIIFFPKLQFLKISCFTFYFCYITYLNIYITFPQSYLYFTLLIVFTTQFNNEIIFQLLWKGLRYYACWIYSSAFILKIINGAFFDKMYGVLTIKSQMAAYLYLNPNSYISQLLSYLIAHPDITRIGTTFVFLLEGFFIVGFFTKKFDKWLVISAFIILIATTLTADVFFIEQFLAIVLVFASSNNWFRNEPLIK